MACKENIDKIELTDEEMDCTEQSNKNDEKTTDCEESLMVQERQMHESEDVDSSHVFDSDGDISHTSESDDDLSEHSDIAEGNEDNEFLECACPRHKEREVGKCCEKQKAMVLKKQLMKLVKECKKLKELMLEKLLQLSKILLEYERSQSSRYLYIPDEKPNLKNIEKIAGNIFPEFRRLERNLRIASTLIKECKFDELRK